MGLDPLEHRNILTPDSVDLSELPAQLESFASIGSSSKKKNNKKNNNNNSSSNGNDHSPSSKKNLSPDGSSGSFEFSNKQDNNNNNNNSRYSQDGSQNDGSTQDGQDSQGQSNPGSKNYKEYVGRHLTSELLFSASIGNLKRIKRCLEKAGKQITSEPYQDYDLRAPLHIACADGSFAIVDYLIKNGVQINVVDRWGATPLECAVFGNHGEIVKYVEQNGGKIKDRLTGTLVKLSDSHLASVAAPQLANSSNIFIPSDSMAWEIPEDEIVDRENIGSGAFGIVMKCKWRGTPVAIKQIHKHMAQDEIARVEFSLELKVMRQLHHPNIVQFLGVVISSETSQVSIVSEFMQGGSLDEIFRRGNMLSICEAANMALDCARGMAYLHGRTPLPVIHRDLKPGNLMLTRTGKLKIGDFGLSKTLSVRNKIPSVSSGNTSEPFVLTGETGSYRYMAPEVFRHEFYGTAVDVYAAAMIYYQLFSGQQPFANVNPIQAAKAVATEDARPPLHNGLMPKEFMTLVRNMWNPIDRKRPSFFNIITYLDPIVEKLRIEEDAKKAQGQGACCVVS
jgi:tRNA A-37 threonylcarbamoyl transferase component Bud32